MQYSRFSASELTEIVNGLQYVVIDVFEFLRLVFLLVGHLVCQKVSINVGNPTLNRIGKIT